MDGGYNQNNNPVTERVLIRFVKLGRGVSHSPDTTPLPSDSHPRLDRGDVFLLTPTDATNRMQRRKYLGTISATVSGVALAGCSSDGSNDDGSSSAENQCDESVLNDDDSNSVRWEGFANGTTEIESIDLELESYVDFPASVSITVFFYREEGDFEPIHQVSRTVEIEGRGFRQIQITDTRSAGGWDGEITELSCP